MEKNKIIKDTFNEILHYFIKIIDYDELDLVKFLNIKKEGKYYRLLTKKILLYILYCIIIYSQAFQVFFIPNQIFFIAYLISLAVHFIGFKILNFVDRLDEISREKFKFTIGFYKAERKDLLDYQCQIRLLYGNHYLKQLIKSDSDKSNFHRNMNQIKKKIDNYTDAIKPIFYKIKQYGLVGTSITLLVGFFTNFLIQYYLNPEIVETLLVLGLLMPATNFLFFGFGYYFLKKRKNRILYNYKAWLQLSKSKLSTKIKDIVSLLYSLEFINLEIDAFKMKKESKSKLHKEIESLDKKKEEIKKRLKELDEKVKTLRKEKKEKDIKSIEVEKETLKGDLKNVKQQKKLKKKGIKNLDK